MPIPLPNLDTLRWEDLVAEGQALIPRYAPEWTDHNVHDPGLTLIELLAWQVEQAIYRANRVPERHRRKFLALAGFAPRSSRPAQTVLTFTLHPAANTSLLPAGVKLTADAGAARWFLFRTLADLTVHPVQIQALQVFDGRDFADVNRFWTERQPIELLGTNLGELQSRSPERRPAFYLGFDNALPAGQPLTLWFWFSGMRTGADERQRLRAEAAELAEARRARRPGWPCETETADAPNPINLDATAVAPDLFPHHAVRTVWEYWDGTCWRPLEPGQVEDDTRGLTLDGVVRLTLPDVTEPRAVGVVAEQHHYLRCRLANGLPDAIPILRYLAVNAVPAQQTGPGRSSIKIPAGVTPPPLTPVAGQRGTLQINLDADGDISELALVPGEAPPEVCVLGYHAATTGQPGQLTVTPAWLGWSSGRPSQTFTLPDAPILDDSIAVWTFEDGKLQRWRQRPDLDASRRTETDVAINATTGKVTFGDGENGRISPPGAPILATYQVTAGASGNIAAGSRWQLAGADDAVNSIILDADPHVVAQNLATITNPLPAGGGTDEESLEAAVDRAVSALWAHERLVELCPAEQHPVTLDTVREQALQLPAPERATTLLDYERLALDVPGTRIARAQAWAGFDPHDPDQAVPGTVTVVVVPTLPRERPQPSAGLLAAVRCFLDRRRIIGTRLVVAGPDYVQVCVSASVRARAGADPDQVRQRIVSALNQFLHPLAGGPDGHGWPFGRDVYPAEILRIIDGVTGVDHVRDLALVTDDEEPQAEKLSVSVTGLVTPGQHEIVVQAAERNGWASR